MKTQMSALGSKLCKTTLLLALTLLAALSPARATLLYNGLNISGGGVDLGDAGRTTQWALFALTGGITIADTAARTFDPNVFPGPGGLGPFSGNPTVRGNVGVSSGSITISGTTKIEGTAYIKTGGLLRKSGTASVHGNSGAPLQGGTYDTLTTKVANDAIAASSQANALAPTGFGGPLTYGGFSLGMVNLSGGSAFVTDANGGAHIVLSMSDFVLSGGATFTLTGSAMTTFVINVSNKFSLVGGSVILAGGVGPENVLFNIVGSGLDLSVTAAAQFSGIILAPSRTINLTGGSTVAGTIIAGKVNISGGGTVNHLPFASP